MSIFIIRNGTIWYTTKWTLCLPVIDRIKVWCIVNLSKNHHINTFTSFISYTRFLVFSWNGIYALLVFSVTLPNFLWFFFTTTFLVIEKHFKYFFELSNKYYRAWHSRSFKRIYSNNLISVSNALIINNQEINKRIVILLHYTSHSTQ